MSDFAHNLNIGATTWHSKWYHHWLTLTGRESSSETLCHYVRVLLFWAPLAWFFRGRVFKIVPPWTIVSTLLVGGTVITLCVLWPEDAVRVLLILAGFIALVALASGMLFVLDEGPHWARVTIACITFPLWIIPMLIVVPIVFVVERYEKAIAAFKDWWTRPRHWLAGTSPIIVLLTVIVIAVLTTVAILDFKTFLSLVLFVVGFLVGLVVLGCVFLLLDEAKGRRHAGKPVFGEKFASVSETAKLGATYIANKKRGSRICPFIRFEDSTEVSLSKETT